MGCYLENISSGLFIKIIIYLMSVVQVIYKIIYYIERDTIPFPQGYIAKEKYQKSLSICVTSQNDNVLILT